MSPAASVPGTAGTLRRADDIWIGSFQAMASPCEVLMEVDDRREAGAILSVVASEARRIESKFSRYLPGNIVHRINSSPGRPVPVDEETGRLLSYCAHLHELSGGRFDITSGALRRAWTFDGGGNVPSQDRIEEALRCVGWDRARWDGESLLLEEGMEIDLGGVAKEYAVDRAAALVLSGHRASCVVNFGGDLVLTLPRRISEPWRVGVESPDPRRPGATRVIHISSGGLATSGSTRRYLVRDGVRYGHILDPTTGWPVPAAPLSVTVAAGSCVEAGMLSTLAMLEGAEAEAFLEAQGCKHWIER